MSVGQAIRRAYEGRATQKAIAEHLGVAQPTVSGWINGPARPDLDQLAELEDFLKRPRGYVLRLAGYVDEAAGVVEALESDTRLEDVHRDGLIALYRFWAGEAG